MPRLCATLVLLALVATARADGFNAAVEDAASHNRAALAYLREERISLALLEIDRLRESFGLLSERYGKERPAAHRDNPDYVTMLVDVPLRMVTAHMMINFGRLAIAYNSLVAVCGSLNALRLPDAEEAPACPPPIELRRPPD
jgi:hypothetical protein